MGYLFWGAFGIIVYVYLGYPLLMTLLVPLGKRWKQGDELPSVSLLIAAYNEAKVIEEKLENSLQLDYPDEKIEIIIASDGSDDGTNEIVQRYADDGILLNLLQPRGGKTSAINRTFSRTRGDIVVFSDANTMYAPDALRKLVRHFADPSVGAVTGDVRLINDSAGFGESEGLYYRYERYIQSVESKVHAIIGVDGAMYAIRRELFHPPSDNIILDDFVISMNVARRGFRVLYDPQAIAAEDSPPNMKQEFRRRVRMFAGGFQALKQREGLPQWHQGRLWFGYLSHKLLRWLVPGFLVLMLVSNVALVVPAPNPSSFYVVSLSLQATLYTLALLGWKWEKLTRVSVFAVPFYFCMANAAALVGFIRAVSNTQKVTWRKADRTVNPRLHT